MVRKPRRRTAIRQQDAEQTERPPVVPPLPSSGKTIRPLMSEEAFTALLRRSGPRLAPAQPGAAPQEADADQHREPS